ASFVFNCVLKGSSENNASSTGKGTGAELLAAVGEVEGEADGVGLPAVFTFVLLTGSVEQPATKSDRAINRPSVVFLNLLMCDYLSMFLVARRCAIRSK